MVFSDDEGSDMDDCDENSESLRAEDDESETELPDVKLDYIKKERSAPVKTAPFGPIVVDDGPLPLPVFSAIPVTVTTIVPTTDNINEPSDKQTTTETTTPPTVYKQTVEKTTTSPTPDTSIMNTTITPNKQTPTNSYIPKAPSPKTVKRKTIKRGTVAGKNARKTNNFKKELEDELKRIEDEMSDMEKRMEILIKKKESIKGTLSFY